jgi:hypothetical protein
MLSYTPPVMHQARSMRRLEHSRPPAGMSREGAYRLRSREPDGLFATAWNRAVTPPHLRSTRAEVDEGHIRAIAAACGTEGAGLRRRLARESTS